MNPLNVNTLLLIVGLVGLLLNVIIGIVRLRQGRARAGIFSVVLALAACAVIAVGIIGITFGSPATASTQLTTATANQSGKTVSGAQVVPVAQETPNPNGVDPQLLINFIAPRATAIGGLVIFILGFLLYRAERRHEDFNPSNSAGLLNAGAGMFVIVAALVIPILPSQLTGQARVSAASLNAANRAAARIVLTATPTDTFTPSPSATALPSLTPEPSDTPVALVTQISYASTVQSTATACILTTKAIAYLRGDPSERNAAISNIFPGSLLQVTGQSTDQKWWRVIYTDNGKSIEGWVAAQFVTADPACGGNSVAQVGPTLTPSRTPRPSSTPLPTSAGASTVNASNPTGTCTVTTTNAVSLRPDPSLKQPPVAQIPERTALVATEKAANGWFHVQYDGKGGWVGGGAVFAEGSCAKLTVVAP